VQKLNWGKGSEFWNVKNEILLAIEIRYWLSQDHKRYVNKLQLARTDHSSLPTGYSPGTNITVAYQLDILQVLIPQYQPDILQVLISQYQLDILQVLISQYQLDILQVLISQ